MLVLKTEQLSVIRELSPLIVLAAIPAMAAGLSLWPRATRHRELPEQKLSGMQLAGSSLVVCGGLVLVTGLAPGVASALHLDSRCDAEFPGVQSDGRSICRAGGAAFRCVLFRSRLRLRLPALVGASYLASCQWK